MVRWFAIGLLTGCLMAQTPEPPAQSKGTEGQAPAAGAAAPVQGASGQTTAEEPEPASVPMQAKDFPLNRFRDFSAIMVGSLMPRDERERHIYRSGDLLRAESLQGLGYMITDLVKIETFGLAKTGCMRDSHPYLASFPLTEGQADRKFESVSVGKEMIDGHVCHVEDVTISGGKLHFPMHLRFWEAEDLQGFPIKVQVMKGPRSVIQYKNVVIGAQDPTLFMHPNSCKMSLPELPKGTMPVAPKLKPKPTPPADSSPK